MHACSVHCAYLGKLESYGRFHHVEGLFQETNTYQQSTSNAYMLQLYPVAQYI